MQTKKQKHDSRLISFNEASEILGGMTASAIRQRKAGTENLTHVPGLGRRIFLIRAEVEALVEQLIETAQAKERERQKTIAKITNRQRAVRPGRLAIAS